MESIDDKEDMQFADEAFDILGFTKEEKYDVFKVMFCKCTQYFILMYIIIVNKNKNNVHTFLLKVTAVVMHLGEMKFKKKSGKDDQATPDGTETGDNVAKLLGKIAVKLEQLLSFIHGEI